MKSDQHLILRVIAKGLLPLILMYAFYVQFHGETGAGGAFQAGIVIAAALILYALVFGLAEAMRAVPAWFARALAAAGVLLYGGVGIWAMVQGGQFLEYQALFGEAPGGHDGQHAGIILVELGILFTVAGAMITIFYALAGRVAQIQREDW